MSKFNFKPFDKVLVRDGEYGDKWKIEFFEREGKDGSYPYTCMNCNYAECIPYNEETKHLLGTDIAYATKEDEATKYAPGEIVETWISGGIWEEAIYLEFVESLFSVVDAHKIYNKKLGICTQPLNKIRKKVK